MEATNKTALYDMTILVPVYNEEDNIAALEEALSAYIATAPVKVCVLFVNDGSRDSSLEKIKDVCARRDHFFYISSTENHGLSTAMKAGFDTVLSPLTGYIDGDLQTNPEDFNLLLPYTDHFELVAGIRAGRKDSLGKRLQSKIANRFRRAMTGDTATDTGCPLKIIHSDVAKKIPFFDGMHRFLAALVSLEGGKMKELPVRHYPRTRGVSKYHLSNRLVKPFQDCFAFRWMRSRYIRYNIDEGNLSSSDKATK